MKDIEIDTKGEIVYKGIWWTIGRYDMVVLFEAKDEKTAMNMVLRRADRIDVAMLVVVPADAAHPCGPV